MIIHYNACNKLHSSIPHGLKHRPGRKHGKQRLSPQLTRTLRLTLPTLAASCPESSSVRLYLLLNSVSFTAMLRSASTALNDHHTTTETATVRKSSSCLITSSSIFGIRLQAFLALLETGTLRRPLPVLLRCLQSLPDEERTVISKRSSTHIRILVAGLFYKKHLYRKREVEIRQNLRNI